MTKETGIIMSGDHPVKIIANEKTQTRRTWGLEEINQNPDDWVLSNHHINENWVFMLKSTGEPRWIKCPYGGIGDWLWIKETWAICSFSANFAEESQLQVAYRAGEPRINPHPDGMTHSLEWRTVDYETWQKYACQKYYSWQSSMFMPKAFTRIWRPITGLRPEHLQEITEEDAKAEGCDFGGWTEDGSWKTARANYEWLWDSINGKKYPWAGNWWVWGISF